MSDTPETDAEFNAIKSVYKDEYMLDAMADLARKLERERDEARAELHDIRLNLGGDAEGYTLLHAVCVIQNERDEARDTVEHLTEYGLSLMDANRMLKRKLKN